ncbi:MAG: outer membrane lipoprotein-sorting protein [Pseudomonadota bacterium]
MNTPVQTVVWGLAATALTLSSNAVAQTAAEKGLEIAQQTKVVDAGWSDSQAEMKMILRNAEGQESVRDIRIRSLEVEGDGDKSLSIFDKPRDVKGTAFLSFSHTVGNDDQWLYLPALKRVKRISSRNKSGPFMGSEFAYEDLSSFEVEKFTYEYLRDEPCGDDTCYVVQQFPVDKNSGYKRRIVWIDQSEYRMHKTEFYNRRDALLKTLEASAYEQYEGKHWRPTEMHMVNHQNGKSTVLQWSNYAFKTGLDDGDFNKNTLKRAR